MKPTTYLCSELVVPSGLDCEFALPNLQAAFVEELFQDLGCTTISLWCCFELMSIGYPRMFVTATRYPRPEGKAVVTSGSDTNCGTVEKLVLRVRLVGETRRFGTCFL